MEEKILSQKRMAVINDFSGFGRCSLTVSLPIISAMKIQCCALPTAVLSNHTGYSDYFFDDYTDKMKEYYLTWEKLRLSFDGIYTGFLGSVRQVELIIDFIRRFASAGTAVVVDPVMGDNGKPYATIDSELCREIRLLLPLSSVITPNLTEACILAGVPFRESGFSDAELLGMTRRLRDMGAKSIVITGITQGDTIRNLICSENGDISFAVSKSTGLQHAGTGDVFASIIAADCINGVGLETSVKKAADFVARAIAVTEKMNVPAEDGVCFEEILGELIP